MNYSIISPKICCNRCSHIQWADAKHCSACGLSFVFGVSDAWNSGPYSSNKTIKNNDLKLKVKNNLHIIAIEGLAQNKTEVKREDINTNICNHTITFY